MQGTLRNAARRALAAILLAAALPVTAGDLVIHNGFEACWSQAVTKPQFLATLQTAIDGATSCIPPTTSTDATTGITYAVCSQPQCGGATPGCPVTLRAGAFSGDFGSGQFNATGSADDIVAPVAYSGGFVPPGACTISVSAIALAYAPHFAFEADGNDGAYVAGLPTPGVSIASYSAAGTGTVCMLAAASYGAMLKAQAESAANSLVADLLAPTVGASVCPLLP